MDYKQIEIDEFHRLGVKILLVTANEIEREELLKRIVPWADGWLRQCTVAENNYIIGYFGRYIVAHVHCKDQGAIRPGGSIQTLNAAYELIQPELVIMVGIAYGADRNTQKIGDVLISKCIKSTDIVKRREDHTIENRNMSISPSVSMTNVFCQYAINENINFTIHTGTIISGEPLINDPIYKHSLFVLQDDKSIVGGEMEGFGMASCLSNKGTNNWILIKGISDWADGNKDENKTLYQRCAVKNAIYVCWRIFVGATITTITNVSAKILFKQYNRARTFINGFAVFYFRQLLQKGKGSLDKEMRHSHKHKHIPINNIESVEIVENTPKFITAGYKYVQTLQSKLKCNNYEIMNIDTNEEIIKFYQNNKGKSSFYPVTGFRAIIFDFDGTLTYQNNYSSWELIWLELGYEVKDCAALHRKFSNNDISHTEWCDLTAEKFKEKRLDRNIMDKIVQKMKTVSNIKEVFEKIKYSNIKMYICSGSINYLIKAVLKDSIGLITEYSSNEFYFDDSGLFTGIKGTPFDFEGKVEYVREKAKEIGCNESDILFIGNSNNDELVYKSKAKTLVVNPRETNPNNREMWNYIIKDMDDLMQILEYIPNIKK